MQEKEYIRQIIKECIEKLIISESYDDTAELIAVMPSEILLDIKEKRKIVFPVIPKMQYHAALKEFTQNNGRFVRFPVKYIYRWKDIVVANIAKLNAINAILGHSQWFPHDDFNDIFDEDGAFTRWIDKMNKKEGTDQYNKYSWDTAYEYLEEVCHADWYLPRYSNGHTTVSDFGIKPLLELAAEISEQDDPNEIIVTINKILDITHPRSDLAELFIEGGQSSLYDISNN